MQEIKRVTVIGAGIMGFGIAKSIFKHNIDVTLYDSNEVQLEKTCEKLKKGARRSMDPDKVHIAKSLKEAVEDCDLLIEAVVEDLEIKSDLFFELGKLADEKTIFASNTSSLDIIKMGEASGRRDSFIGLHFFNPAYLMRLIEVVIPETVNHGVEQSVMAFIKTIKKSGIICKPSPGFIVNRLLIPTLNEAFYILDNCSDEVSRIEVANGIDSFLTDKGIFLMGLFDLTDLTGLDTALAVAERIYHGFGDTPRYKPSPLLRSYVEKGFTGRKTGRGIYYYSNNENDPDRNPRLDESGKHLISSPLVQYDFLPLLSVIVNESFRILEEGIARSFRDIDTCLMTGAHWPKGPFDLLKEYGLDTIKGAIEKLYEESGNNPRYEPSPCFTKPSDEILEFLNL